jgi:hypothetical protein
MKKSKLTWEDDPIDYAPNIFAKIVIVVKLYLAMRILWQGSL